MTPEAKAELIDLAGWITKHFALDGRAKIHTATEAEKIYAEIVRRIGSSK